MPTLLTIGSRPDCDLVVRSRTVSGRHCRLSRDTAGYILEDLNSTNGTFYNGQRVLGSIPITLTPGDTIHLGSHPLPAVQILPLFEREPAPVGAPAITVRTSEVVIGRAPECDQVVDLPMVSSRHARIFWSGDRFLIEDLGSSNGTYVNGNRITNSVVVVHGDLIALGSSAFVLDITSWQPEAEHVNLHEGVAILTEPPSAAEQKLVSATTAGPPRTSDTLIPRWRLAGLVVQAPVLSLLIVAFLGSHSPAQVHCWLVLEVLWLGLSGALLSGLFDRRGLCAGFAPAGLPSVLSRLLVAAALCVFQCLLAWGIVAAAASLKAAAVSALAFLVLTSAVGLVLGLLLVVLAPRPDVARVLLPAAVLLLGLFGGVCPALLRFPIIPGVMPSRWAFEGLLLLEDAGMPDRDLAQEYFPADSLRMGETADALALGLMLIGLLTVVVFMATSTPSRQPVSPVSPAADT